MDNQLNEENLQLAFNFNPSDGTLTKNRIVGEILIEENNKRIAIQESSDKIAIDLGYSIDGEIEDMEFTLNLEKLLIKRVYQKWELVEVTINENEVFIVTDEPSLRTCLWLNKNSIGKTLNYKIISQNTSISSWMLDIIARKLNKFDVDDIVSLKESVSDINTSITTLGNEITISEENITNLSADVNTVNENIENINTSLTALNDEVTELQNSSGGSGSEEIPEIDSNGYSILRQKKLIWRPRTTDYGGYPPWYCMYSNVEIIRFSDGRAELTAECRIYNSDASYKIPVGEYTIAYIGSPVKLGKIYSLDFSDITGFKRPIGSLKLAVEKVELENSEANDPEYGAFDVEIRNLHNKPYNINNANSGLIYEMNILFDLPESYITDYDYIL